MKILVTGVGITGKSAFRRRLVRILREIGWEVTHYDVDEFTKLRCPEDIDCKAPNEFRKDVLYVIEDIHGPEIRGAYMQLKEYDLIVYLLPGRISHLMFWFSRCWRWFQFGQFSWEKGLGWKGTGRPYDYRNILPIIKAIIRDFKNRGIWIAKDIDAIAYFPHIIIHPYWTLKGIRFSFF